MAGFIIAIGCIVNLLWGQVAGAVFFSVGLMAICIFKLNLFTGKAGKLFTNEITAWELCRIWFENLTGSFYAYLLVLLTPIADKITPAAQQIMEIRCTNTVFANIILGIFCGLLMYIAVEGFARTGSFVIIVFPVATFILCGFNHCIADMFYTMVGLSDWTAINALICTTVGNIIGTNIIPIYKDFKTTV